MQALFKHGFTALYHGTLVLVATGSLLSILAICGTLLLAVAP